MTIIQLEKLDSQTNLIHVESINALAFNNARKIIATLDNKLHIIYSNEGNIFYIFSDDGGKTWSRELNISNSLGIAIFPCIAADADNYIHIVWQDNVNPYEAHQTGKFNIYYKGFVNAAQAIQKLPVIIGQSVGDCEHPVVDIGENSKLIAAWSADMGLSLEKEINFSEAIKVGSGTEASFYWQYPKLLGKEMGFGQSLMPALAIKGENLFIVWSEHTPTEETVNLVKYKFNNKWSGHFPISYEAFGPVLANVGISAITITSDTLTHFAFTISSLVNNYPMEDGLYYVTYKKGDTLSYARGYRIDNTGFPAIRNPVIGADSKNNIYVIWEQITDKSEIWYNRNENGIWEIPERLVDSNFPAFHPHFCFDRNDSLCLIWLEKKDSGFDLMFKKLASKITKVKQIRPNQEELVEDFSILSLYPNPFFQTFKLNYFVSRPTRIQINIYNILGQRIKDFENFANSGDNFIEWNGTDTNGTIVPDGIYYAILRSENSQHVVKFCRLRH